MTDLNNKLNLNNMRAASYPHSFKSDEDIKPKSQNETNIQKVDLDASKAAESYGRALIKQSDKLESPETVETVKNAVDAFLNNPNLIAAGVKASDDAYDLLQAQGTTDAYEKACCGACEAVENKA